MNKAFYAFNANNEHPIRFGADYYNLSALLLNGSLGLMQCVAITHVKSRTLVANSLNRLIRHGYIVRIGMRYHITLSGKYAVSKINGLIETSVKQAICKYADDNGL